MPPKRKPSTPFSKKRTPKKTQKAVPSQASRNIHYPGGGLQTSFAVESMSLFTDISLKIGANH
jgi:hypothetical protein